jgi:hypothetical protein
MAILISRKVFSFLSISTASGQFIIIIIIKAVVSLMTADYSNTPHIFMTSHHAKATRSVKVQKLILLKKLLNGIYQSKENWLVKVRVISQERKNTCLTQL